MPTIEPTIEADETQQPTRGTWAQDPPTPLLVNAAVRVLLPELNVRDRPWLGANVIGVVTPDNILRVSSPPFEADGYIWYQGVVVSQTGEMPALPHPLGGAGEPTSGWFAATKGSTAYVTRVDSRCPQVVDLKNVSVMLPAERLGCFGDRPLELEGTFGCSGCSVEISGRYEPAWLAYPGVDLLWYNPDEGDRVMRIRFRGSGSERPAQGSIIRVTGHFRDEAAAQCVIATFYPWDRLDGNPANHDLAPIVARQLCRQELVVESYEVTGTDPRF